MIEKWHTTRNEFGVLKRYICYDGHDLSGFTLRLKNDTLFTQTLFTFTPRKGNFFQACHIKRIQWYAALGRVGHLTASTVAWAVLLGGLVGTVLFSLEQMDTWIKYLAQGKY